MDTSCCICLDTTKNKVCRTCNCYSHPSCWGKFLKQSTKRVTVISGNSVYLVSSLHVKCPQCRQKIKTLKPLTRSDTYTSRTTWFNLIISDYVDWLNSCETIEDKDHVHRKIVRFLVYNKNLLKNDYGLSKMVKKYLRLLYRHSRQLANLNYYYIYGKQLERRVV